MSNPNQIPGQRRPWRRATLVAVLLAGTALGGFATGHASLAAVDTQGTAGSPVNPPGTAVAPHTLPDFTGLVAQVKPAVVSITTKLKDNDQATEDQQGAMPELPFPFNQMVPQHRARAVEARGSGFIIDANGTIVTNNHVVRDATSV
ncbi:MAG TPA: hypothetical protein VIG49_13850, partial [Acetobacteraceae bacterium]